MARTYRPFGAAGRLNARPWAAFAAAALLASMVAACAAQSPRPPALPALAGHTVPTIASVDLLAMTPEMREFTDRHARSGSDESPRAWRLAYASLDPYLLDFDYDPMVTLPADEAFRAWTRGGSRDLAAGVQLAQQRAGALRELMERDPQAFVPATWSPAPCTAS